MLKGKWDNILNNANVNEDDRLWLDAIFDRMETAEADVNLIKERGGDFYWELKSMIEEEG